MTAEAATSVRDIRPLMTAIAVKVKVLENVFISEKGTKNASECLVGDETATILLKARGKEADEITAGRSLEITGCKVDMYYGSMRLVLDADSCSITEIPTVTPKKEINMSLLEFESVVVSAYTNVKGDSGTQRKSIRASAEADDPSVATGAGMEGQMEAEEGDVIGGQTVQEVSAEA